MRYQEDIEDGEALLMDGMRARYKKDPVALARYLKRGLPRAAPAGARRRGRSDDSHRLFVIMDLLAETPGSRVERAASGATPRVLLLRSTPSLQRQRLAFDEVPQERRRGAGEPPAEQEPSASVRQRRTCGERPR